MSQEKPIYKQVEGIIVQYPGQELEEVVVSDTVKNGKRLARFKLQGTGVNSGHIFNVTLWEEANLSAKLPFLVPGTRVFVDGKFTKTKKQRGDGYHLNFSVSDPRGCNVQASAEVIAAVISGQQTGIEGVYPDDQPIGEDELIVRPQLGGDPDFD